LDETPDGNPEVSSTPYSLYGFAGVILAAGESSRMGTDKALLPYGEDTLLGAAIRRLTPFTQLVIVVAGTNTEKLKIVVYANGAFLVVNPEPEAGQFSSLRVGLQEVLNRGRDVAIITHVDRPPAEAETLHRLIAEFGAKHNLPAATRRWAIVPQVDGKHGHPIIAGREMIEEFLRAPNDVTARDVEHKHHQRMEYVDVPDRNVITNLNTPDEYNAYIQSLHA
jgi:molybdenum cofactor cytidylyltransferase